MGISAILLRVAVLPTACFSFVLRLHFLLNGYPSAPGFGGMLYPEEALDARASGPTGRLEHICRRLGRATGPAPVAGDRGRRCRVPSRPAGWSIRVLHAMRPVSSARSGAPAAASCWTSFLRVALVRRAGSGHLQLGGQAASSQHLSATRSGQTSRASGRSSQRRRPSRR
jgi:hypothetical protein